MDINPTKVHFKVIISMWQIFKYLVSSSKLLMNETKKKLKLGVFNVQLCILHHINNGFCLNMQVVFPNPSYALFFFHLFEPDKAFKWL